MSVKNSRKRTAIARVPFAAEVAWQQAAAAKLDAAIAANLKELGYGG